MNSLAKRPWKSFNVLKTDVDLSKILRCGQAFRWKEISDQTWAGVVNDMVFYLRQSDDTIYYVSFSKKFETDDAVNVKSNKRLKLSYRKEPSSCSCFDDTDREPILKDYFNLKIDLSDLLRHWSKIDSSFKKRSHSFQGVRVLRQDPIENLFTFICSSNNNISRITSMVDNLCTEYGDEICDIDGIKFYTFAKVSRLAENGVNDQLRKLGFGYRSDYIHRTAKLLMEKDGDVNWLYNLRTVSYYEAKRSLLSLHGVGSKVADCVCLMSLDKTEAVPVDTHIWQIALTYIPSLVKKKTLTDKVYQEIGDHFRSIWGEYAGWAQAILFASDLKQLSLKGQDKTKCR